MIIDLTSILINLSNSLLPIQSLLSGMGYLIGILMIITGLIKFKKLGETRGASSGGEGMGSPLAFIFGGGVLIFLPSSFSALSNTVFGPSTILSYPQGSSDPFRHAMGLLIETAGLVWFVRGTVLLVNASKPGEKEGSKGLAFLVAGVFAMNFDATVSAVGYTFSAFFAGMASIKTSAGF